MTEKMRVAALHLQRINPSRLHIIKREMPRPVFHLLLPAPHRFVADIIEIPTGDAREIENHFVARLVGPVKTRPVRGAALIISLKSLRQHWRSRKKSPRGERENGIPQN